MFCFLVPSVQSVSQVKTSGGALTVQGNNFGNDPNKVSNIQFGGYECAFTKFIQAHTSFSCLLSAGVGVNLNSIVYHFNKKKNTLKPQ